MLRRCAQEWVRRAPRAALLRATAGPYATGRQSSSIEERGSSDEALPAKGVVLAVCTADAYDMARIGTALLAPNTLKDALTPHRWVQHDALHLSLPDLGCDSTLDAPPTNQSGARAFVFASGCVVVWGRPDDVWAGAARLQAALQPYAHGEAFVPAAEKTRLDSSRVESLDYETDAVLDATLRGETVVVPVDAPRIMAAVSHGLAVSVRLAMLEERLEQHAASTRDIPAALAAGTRLRVSRSDVLQMTGALLSFRADLNIHSDAGESSTPDRYWSEPRLAAAYDRVARCLDVRPRVSALNRRLDCANELAATLRMHLSERHGLKLEWGIIALIAVEVIFELLHVVSSSLL